MQDNIFSKMTELTEQGRTFALCTVIRTQGSTPAKPGAKMVVMSDGSTYGTVGGAEVELDTKNRALESLKNGKSEIAQFDLLYKREGGVDLACGGKVEVFIEIMNPPPHVLLCGGGHICLALSKILVQMDYFYSVFDPRSEYASKDRFPNARNLFTELPSVVSGYAYILVCTYSQQLDYDLTKTILQSNSKGPIGLIGSKAKRSDFIKRFEKDGITSEMLSRLESPVGVEIGAKSVPEIAISIAASIVKTFRI